MIPEWFMDTAAQVMVLCGGAALCGLLLFIVVLLMHAMWELWQ